MTAALPGRFFLVGCPRSGTTLLQHMLAAQAQIVSLPETHFVQQLLRSEDHRRQGWPRASLWRRVQQARRGWQARLGWVPRHQAQRAWRAVPELSCPLDNRAYWQSTRQQLRGFVAALDGYCLHHGGTAWLEKTPDHLFYLHHITEHIGGARVIHLLRDGEEVVASLHDAARRYPPWHPFVDLDHAVDRWNRSLQESLRWQAHPQHLLLRYEALLQAPAQTLSRVLDFLGLAGNVVSPGAADRRAPVSLVRADEPWKHDAAGPLRDRRKFERMFSPGQQARIRARLQPLPVVLQQITQA